MNLSTILKQKLSALKGLGQKLMKVLNKHWLLSMIVLWIIWAIASYQLGALLGLMFYEINHPQDKLTSEYSTISTYRIPSPKMHLVSGLGASFIDNGLTIDESMITGNVGRGGRKHNQFT